MPQTVEVLPVPIGKIAALINDSGVEETTAIALRDSFQPIADIIAQPLAEAAAINVTDATQLTEMKQARALRLKLKDARVECEKTRKALKEDSLKRGKAIDEIARAIKDMIEPAEERLLHMEQFAERAEAERKAKLKASREELLAPFNVDSTFYDLSNMTESTFATLLETTRLAHEARIAAAAKAEADRIAAEQARIAEEKRIREENARLQREAEEQARAAAAERARVEAERKSADEAARKEREAIEAKAAEERRKLEAAAAAERAERERLEQAERARVAAELAKKQAEAAAAKKAAKAPDKAKVATIADALNAITLPECATPEGKELTRKIGMEIINLAERVKAMASSL